MTELPDQCKVLDVTLFSQITAKVRNEQANSGHILVKV